MNATRKRIGFGEPTAGLRFACVWRVSTKGQLHGESPEVQRTQVEAEVKRLGGILVGGDSYSGAEGATPTANKALLRKLLADGALGLYDCVMLPRGDRLLRGHKEAEGALDYWQHQRIRLFLGTQEYDLGDIQARMLLGIVSHIGRAQAATQKLASDLSKVTRLLRGWPVGGPNSWPYGRKIANPEDRDRDHAYAIWAIDEESGEPDKLRGVAEMYEKKPDATWNGKIAKEFGGSGTAWRRRFKNAGDAVTISYARGDVKLHLLEVNGQLPPNVEYDEATDELRVHIAVEPIVGAATIARVFEKSAAQRTSLSRKPADEGEVLRGYLRCAVCGSSLNAHRDSKTSRTYLDHNPATMREACSKRFGRYDHLRTPVTNHLLSLVTDADQLEAAIKAAADAFSHSKPAAAKRRKEVGRELREVQAKIEALGDEWESTPAGLRATLRAKAERYQSEKDALEAEATRLDADLRVVKVEPVMPELRAFLRRVLPTKPGSKPKLGQWSVADMQRLVLFLFGPRHKRAQGTTDAPGIYLSKVDDRIEFEVRAAMDISVEGLREFYGAFDFSGIKHPLNPLGRSVTSRRQVNIARTRL